MVLFFCLSIDTLFALESYWQDGKIVFKKADVNGVSCYTDYEIQEQKDKFTPTVDGSTWTNVLNIVYFTPSAEELVLSTCSLKFYNYTEWWKAQNGDKTSLSKMANELKKKYEEYDLNKESEEYKDYKSRFDWIENYTNGLP